MGREALAPRWGFFWADAFWAVVQRAFFGAPEDEDLGMTDQLSRNDDSGRRASSHVASVTVQDEPQGWL